MTPPVQQGFQMISVLAILPFVSTMQIFNPNVSPQCQIGIKARINTVTSSCYSVFDYQYLDAENPLPGLLSESFAFLPTVCSKGCSVAIEDFAAIGNSQCQGEVIVSSEFTEAMINFFTPLTIQTVPYAENKNLTGPPLRARKLRPYFEQMNTTQFINFVTHVRNVGCVKDSNAQDDSSNQLDNSYCLKTHFNALDASKSIQEAGMALKSFYTYVNKTDISCDVCAQNQVNQMLLGLSLIPPFDVFNFNLARLNATIAKTCPNLPALGNPSVSQGHSSSSYPMILILLFALLI